MSEAEKTLLVQQLENVTMYPDEDPKTFFTRNDKLVNMMRRVGITKTEEQIVHIIARQLSDEYIVQKAIIDANPAEYPRVRAEHLVRNAYANRKVKEVMQSDVPSPAAQRDSHALAIGGFRQGRGGGGGGQRNGSGGFRGEWWKAEATAVGTRKWQNTAAAFVRPLATTAAVPTGTSAAATTAAVPPTTTASSQPTTWSSNMGTRG